MAPPVIYSDSSNSIITFNDISFNDGETLMTTVYTDIQSTFSLAGTDAHLMTIQYDNAGLSANIVADAVADHKTKEDYSFTVVATSVSNTTEVTIKQIIVTVTATTLPVFQPVSYNDTNSLVTNQTGVNELIIADGAKVNVFKFATDELVSGSTFLLTGTDNDNAKVTLTSPGQLNLVNYASHHDGTLTIEVTATSVHGLNKVLTMTITFTDGNPTFLQSLNGVKQSGAYVFTVADALNVLSNSGNMFSTDSALYTLTGADSAKFTVSPTTGGNYSKTAVLTLTNAASKQDHSSYSLNIVATDANANSTTNAIVVNIGEDTTVPNLTFTKHDDSTLTLTATFTINDNNGTGVGTVSADEICTFSIVAGNADNADLFQLSNTSEVAANTDVNFSLKNAAAINLDAIYTFTIRATDAGDNTNQTDQPITVKVIDDTKPVLTITSTAVANGTNTFTNLQSVPFVIVSSEDLSGVMVMSDISLNHGTGGVAPTISDFVGTSLGARFNIQPQGDSNLVTISVLAGTVGDVVVGTNPQNTNALTEFKFQRDVTTPSIDISGSTITNEPRGYPYSDAGATSTEALDIVTVINVDPKTVDTYYVTYTIEDSAGNRRSKSRTVNITAMNERSKPVISLANNSTLTVVYTIGANNFGVSDDDALIKAIVDSSDSDIPIARDFTEVNRSIVGSYDIKYNGNDDVYGVLVELSRTINIQDNIDFSLESLNADSTLTKLSLTSTQAVADSPAFSAMPGVVINMSITDWNDIFYMSPEGDGLTELSELAHIDVFGTEEINYKTNSANLPLITGLISAKVNQNTSHRSDGGNVNESLSNQLIKQVVTSNWAYDIFGRENMSDLFANTPAVQAEIDGKLNGTSAGTLDALWKAHIDTGNNMNNNITDATNLSRQLMLQLHAAISSTTSKTRLTNSGMFLPANKVSDSLSAFNNYYPFKFEIGDKLSFSMKFNSPQHSVANYYPSGVTPAPVSIKVQISMVA